MKKNIFFLIIGMITAIVSIAFFTVEKFLPDGWYYIPDSANLIALVLFLIWSGIFTVVLWYFSARLKKRVNHKGVRGIITVITSLLSIFTVLFLLLNCWGYSEKHQVKVEQYDDHLALYVKNTFVRTKLREPCYRYEENWLLMRKLTDEELSSAILEYGNPENYYN